jgi:hypothetical protein
VSLIQIGGSIYKIDRNDPNLCKSFDEDCAQVVLEGRAALCAAGIMACHSMDGVVLESEGQCPFIEN